jgi:hypothetical protein
MAGGEFNKTSQPRGSITASRGDLCTMPLYLHMSRDRLGLGSVAHSHPWDISMQTETALQRIHTIQKTARDGRTTSDRPKWPMIVLRSPKG